MILLGGKKLLKKKIIIIFIMLFTLSGCSSSTSNKTDDITETKTFLYNYDYETDSMVKYIQTTMKKNPLLI